MTVRLMQRLGLLMVLCASFGVVAAGSAPGSPYGLRERIESFLEERSPLAPSAIEVPPLANFLVPGLSSDQVSVELSSHPRANRIGRVPVTVTLSAAGHVVRRGVVNALVRVETPVLVTTKAVRRGESLSAEHFTLEPRDVSELPEGWLDDPNAVIGQLARRRVAPGSLFRSSWAQKPLRVHRGELVRFRLEHGPLVIEGKGVARRDAHAGEWIRVVNADSKRELYGQVAADGVIHVQF